MGISVKDIGTRKWNSILAAVLFLYCLPAFTSPPLLLKAKESLGSLSTMEEETSLFIVQWKSPVQEEEKQLLEKHGVSFVDYIPHQAFLVKVDNFSSLPKFSFVERWLPYRAAFKLAPALAPSPLFVMGQELEVVVEVVPGANVAELEKHFLGPLVPLYSRIYLGKTLMHALSNITKEAIVTWVEPYYPVELLHLTKEKLLGKSSEEEMVEEEEELSYTGYESGTRVMGLEKAYENGFNGEGSYVAVADTGVDLGSVIDMHLDLLTKVVSGVNLALGGRGDWSDPMGHGTHVAGSIVGLGIESDGNIRGAAWGAKLHAQGLWSSIIGNLFPPFDLKVLFTDSYSLGFRIHSNSWGMPRGRGVYNALAKATDSFIFEHPDFFIAFAVGNDGVDLDRDGVIDEGSILSPSTAKNVLSVGASQNYILKGGIQKQASQLRDGDKKWGVEPIASSYFSHNPLGMAVFSSRGPTADKRIKPDVVAPGTNIVSVRGRKPTVEDAWGVFDENYIFSGGTSMATPLASGFAAVLRAYLLETTDLSSVSAALLKATLINTAFDLYPGQFGIRESGQEQPSTRPNMHQGFGRLSTDRIFGENAAQYIYVDDWEGLSQGEERSWEVESKGALRVTLVYTDTPGALSAQKALVNDLDLEIHQGETIHHPNHGTGKDSTNNVENIDIQSNSAASYRVLVRGARVPSGVNGKQAFALVISYE